MQENAQKTKKNGDSEESPFGTDIHNETDFFDIIHTYSKRA